MLAILGIFVRLIMVELRGNALLAAVTTLTSLGFLMIGYDNGLLGGLGTSLTAFIVIQCTDNT